MKTIRKYILTVMVLIPSMAIAATDCQIIEYPDHYAAVCIGDEKPEPVRTPASKRSQVPEAAQIVTQTSKGAQGPEAVQDVLEAKAPFAIKTEYTAVAVQSSMAESARLAMKAPGTQTAVDVPVKELKTEYTPVAAQPSMAESARLAVKASGTQTLVALQGKEQFTGQSDAAKSPVTTGQQQSNMISEKVANDSNIKGKGNISFVTRMKNNLAVSSMSKH